MNRRNMLFSVLATFGIALVSHAALAAPVIGFNLGGVAIDVDLGPPPPRAELVPPQRFGYAWAPGYWRVAGRHHEWLGGRWIEARRDHAWVPDRWTQADHHWRYEPGRWERASRERAYDRRVHGDDRSWREHSGERYASYR